MQLRLAGLLVTAVSLGAAQAVFAADMPVKAPIFKAPRSVVTDNWSGWYAGGHLGGGWTNNRFSDPLGVLTPAGGGDTGAYGASVLGGGQMGFNWQNGPYVFGIQGDFTFTDMKATTSAPLLASTTLSNDTKWVSTFTGRLGYTQDRMLWYFKGGAAWVRNNYAVTDSIIGTNATSDNTRSGYVLGGGWEYAFAHNMSAFVEYDYVGLDNKTITLTGSTPFNFKQDLQMIKFGFNYRLSPWGHW